MAIYYSTLVDVARNFELPESCMKRTATKPQSLLPRFHDDDDFRVSGGYDDNCVEEETPVIPNEVPWPYAYPKEKKYVHNCGVDEDWKGVDWSYLHPDFPTTRSTGRSSDFRLLLLPALGRSNSPTVAG